MGTYLNNFKDNVILRNIIKGFVRKLYDVVPELLPIIRAILRDHTVVHYVVGFVNLLNLSLC